MALGRFPGILVTYFNLVAVSCNLSGTSFLEADRDMKNMAFDARNSVVLLCYSTLNKDINDVDSSMC